MGATELASKFQRPNEQRCTVTEVEAKSVFLRLEMCMETRSQILMDGFATLYFEHFPCMDGFQGGLLCVVHVAFNSRTKRRRKKGRWLD